jgi:lysophospholipase L1-like esterase
LLTRTALAVAVGAWMVGEAAGAAPPSSVPADDAISLVIIGDSVPYNSPDDCPGCTGFVDGYADAIEAVTGRPVEVDNRSRHDGAVTADIVAEVSSGELDEVVSSADIVLISTGLNDGPPYFDPRPCPSGDLVTDADYFAAIVATTDECVDDVVADVAAEAADVLASVRALAPDAAIGVLTAYDFWSGWDVLEAEGPELSADVSAVIVHALDRWRTALCAEAERVDAVCIDVFGAFNGPDGTQSSGELLASDHAHPSQLGNDVILDLLVNSQLIDLGTAPSTSIR